MTRQAHRTEGSGLLGLLVRSSDGSQIRHSRHPAISQGTDGKHQGGCKAKKIGSRSPRSLQPHLCNDDDDDGQKTEEETHDVCHEAFLHAQASWLASQPQPHPTRLARTRSRYGHLPATTFARSQTPFARSARSRICTTALGPSA